MRCYHEHGKGIEPSLLFFFLILVMLFCNPRAFGCGDDCWQEPVCEPDCDCEC